MSRDTASPEVARFKIEWPTNQHPTVYLFAMFDARFWEAAQPREARGKIVETLSYELLGPSSPEETIDESPLSRYLVGMLAPFGTDVAPEEQEDGPGEDEGEDLAGAAESTPPLSQALSPSSIGISFLVSSSVDRLEVQARWGHYERVGSEEHDENGALTGASADPPFGTDSDASRRRRPRQRWARTAEDFVADLMLRPGEGIQRIRADGASEVWIEHIARPLDDQRTTVSAFLVNRNQRPPNGRPPADTWIFQPELSLAGDGEGVFLPRELEPMGARTDRDLESNALLYRDRREFAVGHGCAVAWKLDGPGRAAEISTDLVPSFELPRVDPREIANVGLDMQALSDAASGEEVSALLRPLADAYARWIQDREAESEGLSEDLSGTASDHLRLCTDALARIEAGIGLLETDSAARHAFSFANRAMLLQRSHTEWAELRRRDPIAAPERPRLGGEWRPFQLAFILLNLRGITDPLADDRAIGDLLWFPTGGGKTEAYLGLTAYTLALRRLRTDDSLRTDAGVAVLMRYTLRLLTIQQFQRASTLMCACELLRQEEPALWGDRRFSVGLWLGRQATPNKHDDSRRAIDRLRAGEPQDEGNPCQLESCPWCGHPLTINDYEIDAERQRTVVGCGRHGCDFDRSAGMELPVVLVDEEIYRECPSMVIATVDKFAQMPWNGEIATIFGNVDRECRLCGFLSPDSDHPKYHQRLGKRLKPEQTVVETGRLAPPELIIQDELHLISGPLGTMVGLYETAVDALCTRRVDAQRVAPKVIASTATVRRAFEQVQSLFARDLRVFPPPALDPDDSFFAVEKTPSDLDPGRLYLGVMAPGKSMKTALVRVAAALLSAGAGVESGDPELADPYLTLVAYFNSLRELGGAVRLMEDDVVARMGQLKSRGLPARNRPIHEELTSRVSSDRIPGLLRRLQTQHFVDRVEGEPLPLDAILASNMISVGVDVNRLGLMTVLGQPKTTAEYIQATSRVGRQRSGPGLVVTIYNWVRPRDLSHYERFRHYHSTLYRNVEAVSATPFSSRARDRGLAGAFVALTRLGVEDLVAEDCAGSFKAADPSIEQIIDVFRRRAKTIVDAAVADEVETALRAYVDQWGMFAQDPLRYGWRSAFGQAAPPPSDVLLRSAEGGQFGHWRAPGSLREVEETSTVYVRGLGDGQA